MSEAALTEVSLPLRDAHDREVGILRIACRPERARWNGIDALIDVSGADALDAASPIQLLEESEYLYEVEGPDGAVRLEPAELFDPNDEEMRTGRLRPGRRTGSISVRVSDQSSSALGRCEVEVRSRKLNYRDEYRWMIGRIADDATEALLQRFSASEIRLKPGSSGSPQTLYQRIALLKALLESDALDSALQLVEHRPHVEFRTEIERLHPSRGLPSGRQAVRALTGPGPRIPFALAGLPTVPEEVERVIHTESLDTVPNRFVKHALERWLGLVLDIRSVLGGAAGAADQRGLREIAMIEHWVTSHLNSPILRDVGPLTAFPAGNQVLQRREGYRDVFRAYLMMEVAAELSWAGGDDIFQAGQRNVATLYEYWVFLELARIVSVVIGAPLDTDSLFSVGEGGLSLDLRRGASTAVVRGKVVKRGRELGLALYFNRQFDHGKHSSWTTPVRPDCSLKISTGGSFREVTWLHFDAKYRLQELKQVLMSPISGDDDDDLGPPTATVKNEDLLKMHAYRDAVRRTAGAYVLYPGTDDQPEKPLRKYHEVLPGLGAFVLRPMEDGQGSEAGVSALAAFIEDVLDHVAAQGTSRERVRYWEGESYQQWAADSQSDEQRLDPVPYLDAPPDDTLVLLGYVKGDEHWKWIRERGLYNVRADVDRAGSVGLDSAELRAPLIVLYNPHWQEAHLFRSTGSLFLRSANEMEVAGYPDPGGDLYLCLGLNELKAEPFAAPDIARAARNGRPEESWAAPAVLTWAELETMLGE